MQAKQHRSQTKRRLKIKVAKKEEVKIKDLKIDLIKSKILLKLKQSLHQENKLRQQHIKMNLLLLFIHLKEESNLVTTKEEKILRELFHKILDRN